MLKGLFFDAISGGLWLLQNSPKVCFHCFGKVFLWCFQRLQKDVKDLPWSISKISPPAFTVFFQTASPSRFFRASRKLFNRPPKVQNAVSYSITLLAQRVFCLSPNVFQKWGKWGGGKSPRLRPISAKITCTALLNSPKVQFFYSIAVIFYTPLCRKINTSIFSVSNLELAIITEFSTLLVYWFWQITKSCTARLQILPIFLCCQRGTKWRLSCASACF